MDRHLYIAGTGRAGTSFLVRYLTALGLDTVAARKGDASWWDESANAGLEDTADQLTGANVPYVVKSPWLWLLIDELIAKHREQIDGVIIPIRDLSHAATSRAIVEYAAMYERAPWLNRLDSSFDVWGAAPGGMVYSLAPMDQARLLAVGFHQLVERLEAAAVPFTFVHFPRFARDADYLFGKLAPLLPGSITAEAARTAFDTVADASRIRVEEEIGGPAVPSPLVAENAALRRRVQKLERALRDREDGQKPEPGPPEGSG